MISYYRSKYPGLILYMILVIASIIVCAIEQTQFALGLLSIGWSIFIMMRVLSLYEMRHYRNTYRTQKPESKRSNHQVSALAYDLLSRLGVRANSDKATRALYCVHERTMMWFFLALLCIGWWVYMQGAAVNIEHLSSLSLFFILGTVFWGGQSYASSEKISNILLFIFGGAMAWVILFEQSGITFTTDSESLITSMYQAISNHMISLFIVSVLVVYSVLILLSSSLRNHRYLLNGLAGIGLLIFLILQSLNHIFTNAEWSDLSSLWIAGFGLFSVFWVRAQFHKRKRHILYFCE